MKNLTNRQTKMQFDRFNNNDVFKIYLNLLYLQLKNTLLTFHIFIFIKENRKKSNWIVVSKMGFPQDYKTRLYVFTIINLLYLQNFFIFFQIFSYSLRFSSSLPLKQLLLLQQQGHDPFT